MLTSNQHNQLVVTRKKKSEPDFILVVFVLFFLSSSVVGCQSVTPSSFIRFFRSLSVTVALSLPTLRCRLLGFLPEPWDQRKKTERKKEKKKNTEGQIYEGHAC